MTIWAATREFFTRAARRSAGGRSDNLYMRDDAVPGWSDGRDICVHIRDPHFCSGNGIFIFSICIYVLLTHNDFYRTLT